MCLGEHVTVQIAKRSELHTFKVHLPVSIPRKCYSARCPLNDKQTRNGSRWIQVIVA